MTLDLEDLERRLTEAERWSGEGFPTFIVNKDVRALFDEVRKLRQDVKINNEDLLQLQGLLNGSLAEARRLRAETQSLERAQAEIATDNDRLYAETDRLRNELARARPIGRQVAEATAEELKAKERRVLGPYYGAGGGGGQGMHLNPRYMTPEITRDAGRLHAELANQPNGQIHFSRVHDPREWEDPLYVSAGGRQVGRFGPFPETSG